MPIKDDFSKLETASFRGIRFPYLDLSTEFTHDIAEHKEPDVDGAFVEATGRGARQVSLRIPFRNGLKFYANPYTVPLFPDQFRAFEVACTNRSTGTLVHPLRGRMRVKVVSFKDSLTPDSRDGVTVDVTFKETREVDTFAEPPAPIVLARVAAAALDAELPKVRIKKPDLKVPASFSFADAVGAIQTATDRVKLLQKQAFGSIERTVGYVGAVESAIVSLHDVTLSNARLAAEQTRYALTEVKLALQNKQIVATLTVQAPMTSAQLSRLTKNSLYDLFALNPIAGLPILKAGTVVRYYT